uniref:OB domain-containing protein n=1 Tax=Heliothis virescens TaxID=7102 RepID=A0A2A4K1F3_HELVI
MALNPRKYLVKDLVNKPTPLDVWIQGTIEQTVGADILIVSDSTGRAKITKCETAHGIIDKSSLRKGTYCCIIGSAVRTKGLPEIQASKFIDLTSQPHMKIAWETEVKEANLFLEGKLIPTI